jgi:hypothetical protein
MMELSELRSQVPQGEQRDLESIALELNLGLGL